eukprot:CAMPEP_0202077760 /NCGR_PEP_ID=MMETSP0964-20121228/5550_1 /ASSEMBLY_ACC=CAM_ASM_000500 /TAXON_ID=4773 /ORGANISM="Schizochytrium aggregatum, Strain ATCC28209" /LENGTH=333 /DNA_ID=CAMNT_0048645045 /DNA_START=359 /DNA_END=1360 /DNA_ORIENTATION=-
MAESAELLAFGAPEQVEIEGLDASTTPGVEEVAGSEASTSATVLEALLASAMIDLQPNENPPCAVSPTKAPMFELVDEPSKAVAVCKAMFERGGPVALDAEGVSLSRTGPLTLLSLLDMTTEEDNPTAYLLDVQVLGRESFREAAKALLESHDVIKVLFDCRTDADALFHQYGVKLENIIDLQTMKQAVDHHTKSYRSKTENGRYRLVPNMNKVCAAHLSEAQNAWLNMGLGEMAPHKANKNVWAERPLAVEALQYAASDAHGIRLLHKALSEVGISKRLQLAMEDFSEIRLGFFRDRDEEVTFETHRKLIMYDASILNQRHFQGRKGRLGAS